MKFQSTGCLAAAFFVAYSLHARDTPKPRDLDKARALVRALGNKSYRTREKAAHELTRMGRDAYVAVAEGADDSDPEIRARCRKLLPAILDLEIKARLDAFLADTDGKQEHNLPGWKRFKENFGNTRSTRELFASLIRTNGRLMEEVEVSAKEFAGERIQARVSTIQHDLRFAANTKSATIAQRDIVQLLFLATKPGLEVPPQAARIITTFIHRPSFHQDIINGEHSAVLRKLTVFWLERQIDDYATAYAIMGLADTPKFEELIGPALKIATNKKAIAHARGTAIAAIGKLGQKEHAKLLEPLIAEKTQIGNFAWQNYRGTTLIGDVALAQTIHLHGEKPGDFGYLALKANPAFVNSYYYQGFTSDAARTEAHKKWKERLANKSKSKLK